MIKSSEVYVAPLHAGTRTTAAAVKLLHGALFLAILLSPFVFVEPSPYEAAVGLLALTGVVAGVGFDRKLLPLALLLIVLNMGAALALVPLMDNSKAVIYAVTSFYLAATAVAYACLFTQDSLRRLEIVRRAYVTAAALACLLGIAGYFAILPGLEFVLENSRVRATFKDPNVFGPFLILPLLFVMQSLFLRRVRLHDLMLFGLFAFALLLSFSRGAWAHFAVSAAVLVVATLCTAQDTRARLRLIFVSMISVAALAGLLTLALSFSAVSDLFTERAKLTQSYDVGGGGRFDLQEKAAGAILENPDGMGPYGFALAHGGQQHNVYLQAFLVYGWAGGFAYVLLVVLTLLIGFRLTFIPTPWRPYLVAALATFCGLVGEGFVVDTDHWRHFYLVLGMIWGLSVATINAARPRRWQPA